MLFFTFSIFTDQINLEDNSYIENIAIFSYQSDINSLTWQLKDLPTPTWQLKLLREQQSDPPEGKELRLELLVLQSLPQRTVKLLQHGHQL